MGKMRFIQNILKIESSSLNKPVQYTNGFTEVIVCRRISFWHAFHSTQLTLWEDDILMFVSHSHFYKIHPQQWCKHGQALQSSWEDNALEQGADWAFQHMQHQPDKSQETSLSYRTWMFTLIAVGKRSSFRFPTSKWFLQVIYRGIHGKVSITTPLSWADTPLLSQMITNTLKCLTPPQVGQTCFLHSIKYSQDALFYK